MLRGQSIKKAKYGVRCWCQHQSFLLLVDEAGQRHLRVIMNHFGHAYLMQASPAMNVSPSNGRRVVLSSVSVLCEPKNHELLVFLLSVAHLAFLLGQFTMLAMLWEHIVLRV